MTQLIKADFWRLIKDKLLWIGLIVSCGLTIFSTLIYWFLKVAIEIDEIEIFQSLFNGRGMFLNSFSAGNNVGLMIPIFISILVVKEFNYGTIRNKIVSGKSRFMIFLSTYLTSLVAGLILYLINLLLALFFGSLLLGYGKPVNGEEIQFIFASLGYGILFYSVFLSFAIFIGMVTRNLGLSIVFNIVLIFVTTILATFADPAMVFVSDTIRDIFSVNPMYAIQLLTTDKLINGTQKDILTSVLSSIFYIGLLFGLGSILFKKADLK